MEPTTLKDELKSVAIMPGALSVMTHGLLRMPTWPAGNLDSVDLVGLANPDIMHDVIIV